MNSGEHEQEDVEEDAEQQNDDEGSREDPELQRSMRLRRHASPRRRGCRGEALARPA